MRTALSFSSLLLAVVLAFNFQSGSFSFRESDRASLPADVNVGRSVRIYTCGATLPPAMFGNHPQRDSVFIDGKMYRSYFNETGLRAVVIPPGETSPTLAIFNLARDPEATGALQRLMDSVPVNTAVALTCFRTIQPKGKNAATHREVLTKTLREVGTQTDPTNDNLVSWAILTLKRPQGWVPLSEVYSRTKGMSISYALDDNRARYDSVEPYLRVDETRQLSLGSVLSETVETGFTISKSYAVIDEVGHECLRMPLEPGARLKWRYVKLESAPYFRTEIGIPSDAYPYVPGARCSLLINDEVVASKDLGRNGSAPDSWHAWRVDLSAYADRWVSLELRAEPLAETLPTAVFWRAPTLSFNPNHAKPKVGFERVQHSLDLNKDGVVGRPEVTKYMRMQDEDKDGFVTEDEAFKKSLISLLDKNGDGKADYEELDASWDLMLDPPR